MPNIFLYRFKQTGSKLYSFTLFKIKRLYFAKREKIKCTRMILGGMYLPYSDSARLLIGIWWLIVMVVVATYSGSLVAFLTFPNMDTAILTIEALLANKNRLTWGFPNGSFLKEYLQNAEEEKYHILLKRAKIYNSSQRAEIIEKVKAGKHVLIDWRSTLR